MNIKTKFKFKQTIRKAILLVVAIATTVCSVPVVTPVVTMAAEPVVITGLQCTQAKTVTDKLVKSTIYDTADATLGDLITVSFTQGLTVGGVQSITINSTGKAGTARKLITYSDTPSGKNNMITFFYDGDAYIALTTLEKLGGKNGTNNSTQKNPPYASAKIGAIKENSAYYYNVNGLKELTIKVGNSYAYAKATKSYGSSSEPDVEDIDENYGASSATLYVNGEVFNTYPGGASDQSYVIDLEAIRLQDPNAVLTFRLEGESTSAKASYTSGGTNCGATAKSYEASLAIFATKDSSTLLAPTSNSVATQYGIEGGPVHVGGNAVFADLGNSSNAYEWYMLVDDGIHKSCEQFEELSSIADEDFVSNEGSYSITSSGQKWINVGDSAALNSAKEVYSYNISASEGSENQFKITTNIITGDTLNISGLTKDKNSIDGCWFKYIAKNNNGQSHSAPFQIRVDSIDRSFTGLANQINWKYNLNGNGEIEQLYTEDTDLSAIIDGDGTLHIPMTINNMVVRSIGGSTDTTPVVPATVEFNAIEIPNTVTGINDYCFAGLNGKNGFSLTIPSTVTKFGNKIAYSSKIKTLKVNSSVLDSYKGFADCQNLESVQINAAATVGKNSFEGSGSSNGLNVSFNASGIKILEYAFAGSKIKTLAIPNGTRISPNAFKNLSYLKEVEIDADEIPNNAFGNDNGAHPCEKVIFGPHVQHAYAAWNSLGNNSTSILADGVTVSVKNNNTFFHADGNAASLRGIGKSTVVYNAAEDNKYNTVNNDSYNAVYSTCYKIEEAKAKNEELYSKFSQSASTEITFLNKGYNPQRDNETEEDYNTRVNNVKNLVKGLEDAGKLADIIADEYYEGQTGILAACESDLFISELLDKADVTVTVLGGTGSGSKYPTSRFYVTRESDFTTIETEINKIVQNSLEEDKTSQIIDYLNSANLKVRAKESDVAEGDVVGTLHAYAIVPHSNGIYSAPFDVTVKTHAPADYAYREYKTYSEIMEAISSIEKEITDLTEEVELYRDLLAFVDELLSDNKDATLADLRDKLEEAQAEYDRLSGDEKTSEEGLILKKSIEAITALLDKGEKIADIKDKYNKAVKRVEELEIAYNTILSALDEFEQSLSETTDKFSFVKKSIDGKEPEKYFLFIEGHEYIYHPEEDNKDYHPDEDIFVHTLHTAYVDKTVDPYAVDLDGNNDGKFQCYCIGGRVFIKGTDNVYTKDAVTYVAEAKQTIETLSAEMVDLEQSLKALEKDMVSVINIIKEAGYEINADENSSDVEKMDEIKKAISKLIGDYKNIKEAISGNENANAEDILKMIEDYQKQLSEIEEDLKDALAGKNGTPSESDKRTYEQLLLAIQSLKDSYDAAMAENSEYKKALESANDTIKNLDDKIGELEVSGETAADKINALLDEIDALNKQIQELGAAGADETTLKKLQEQSDSLQKRIIALLETNAELKGSNDILKSQNSSIQKELDSLKSSISGKDSQILALSTENAALKAGQNNKSSSGSGGGSVSSGSGKTIETEKIIKPDVCEHKWTYKDNNDGTHTKTCSLCNEIMVENHSYDELTKKCDCGALESSGTVLELTDQETCTHLWTYVDNKNGTHTATCALCNLIDIRPHEFIEYTDNEDGTHTSKCACGYEETVDHEFDEDGECICGAEEEEEPEETTSVSWIRQGEENSDEPATSDTDISVEEEQSSGVPAWLIIMAVLAVGAAVFCIYWFIIRKKKTSAQEEDDEEYDDDDFFTSEDDELTGTDSNDDMNYTNINDSEMDPEMNDFETEE